MKTHLLSAIGITLIGGMVAAAADNAVRNPSFAGPAGAGDKAAWHIPALGPWTITNADGADDPFSLRYASKTARPATPVTQAVTLEAGGEYVLAAFLKTDGHARPAVRLLTAGDGKTELARIECAAKAPAGVWRSATARFQVGGQTAAKLVIETAGSGLAGVDALQVVPARDFLALNGAGALPPTENLALGRPYTLVPHPSYALCRDPGDRTQLTDGILTKGYFWTQKTTVGWSRAPEVAITIDLGEDLPVRGVSFRTAAGVAGVQWPENIEMLFSLDGREYHRLGDLVAMSNRRQPPPRGKYAVHVFRTEALQTHARYVKLQVKISGAFCFTDEIQVLRGEKAWLGKSLPGPPLFYPREYVNDDPFNASLKRRLGTDLVTLQNALYAMKPPPADLAALKAEIERLDARIGALPRIDPKGFRSVIPFLPLHREIYALYGKIRQSLGVPPLVVQAANPWDFQLPADLSVRRSKGGLRISAMRGEVRAGALNLVNSTTDAFTATLAFAGSRSREMTEDIRVSRVEWTDTPEGVIIGTALTPLEPQNGAWQVEVPAGMTRQVWFAFRPGRLGPGLHNGRLTVAIPGQKTQAVPVALRVFALEFPARPALHVGGWDYTDADNTYGVTPANLDALLAHMQERYVDSPWAHGAVMGFAPFRQDGAFKTPPDTGRFDRWIARWPRARRYCVFNNVPDKIGGIGLDEPGFAERVGAWIRFWVKHARDKGIRPEQLVLLLVDEPHRPEQDRRIVAWARAITAAEPDVVIWEDVTYHDPTQASPELMAVSDVLCPNRPMLLHEGKAFADFYRAQKAAGKRLDFYSCSGPGFLLDPYAYHRLQAWTCFEFGAESTFFWAFGDTGFSNPWNAYTAKRTSFTPIFLGPASVTPAKQMEAIRESVEDFEYLTMLQRRIAELEAGGSKNRHLGAAKRLLRTVPRRVLADQSADALRWQEPKDRTIADRVRIEIGNLLEKLQE